MGKFLLTCSIVILFILLQTEEIVSISKKGSSRPSSSSSRKQSRPSRPVKPAEKTRKPARHPPVHSEKKPDNPARHPPSHANPPPYNPAHPPHNPANPQNPRHPPPYPVNPQNPAHPPNSPVNPGNPPPYNPAHPPNSPVNPGNPPPYNPAYPYPVNPQNPAHPPPYPVNPQNPAHPPPYPVNPQNPAHPPPYPVNPQNPAHPPPYPVNPQNPAHPPPYPVNPQNPGHHPPYPVNPQNPGHPRPYPVNPQNPGHFPHQPYNPQYPQWGHDSKMWKPKKPKTNMKHIAGAAIGGAAVGALGGYMMGRAMSNLHFPFNNMNEERWWHENRNRYSDRVYYPQYTEPVPQDIFVRDCVNITVKEYVEPTGNKTEDELEATVVTHVVREMCIEQYRTFSSSPGGGGSSRPHGGNPADPKPKGDEVKYVVGEPVVDAPVEDPESYILGSPIAKMYFNFNDSEEERWWNENRHRFATHVYHPNSSQPVSREAFLSECVNVTVGEYVKPSGNQTEDELEARVVTQLANEKCMEMYPRFAWLTVGGSYYNHKSETTLEFKREFKHEQGAAPRGANGHNLGNNAVSDLHFSFENVLPLVHPFVISVLTLITPFLIF